MCGKSTAQAKGATAQGKKVKKPVEKKDAGFQMAGTEQTWEYVVVAVTPAGRVGFRDLGDEEFRVRVEPTEASAKVLKRNFQARYNWKQPGDDEQFRFSHLFSGQKNLRAVIGRALKALGVTPEAQNVKVNKKAPKWALKLAAVA